MSFLTLTSGGNFSDVAHDRSILHIGDCRTCVMLISKGGSAITTAGILALTTEYKLDLPFHLSLLTGPSFWNVLITCCHGFCIASKMVMFKVVHLV